MIINLDDARRRRAEKSTPPNPVLDALDSLAVALADHGHTWTAREVALYETAVAYAQGITTHD